MLSVETSSKEPDVKISYILASGLLKFYFEIYRTTNRVDSRFKICVIRNVIFNFKMNLFAEDYLIEAP